MAHVPLPPVKPGTPTNKTAQTAVEPGNPTAKTSLTALEPGNPTAKTTLTALKPGVPTNKTAQTALKPGNPTNKTSQTALKPGNPTVKTSLAAKAFPRSFAPKVLIDFANNAFSLNGESVAENDFITYSRSSAASFINRDISSNKSYDTFIDYDFNGTVTNLFTRSEEMDHANWVKSTIGSATAPAVTSNAGLAPDGTLTADRVVFQIASDVAGNSSTLRQTIAQAGDTNVSFWVKSYSGLDQYISISTSGGALMPVKVDGTWRRISGFGIHSGSQGNGLDFKGGFGIGHLTSDILVWGGQATISIKTMNYVRTSSAPASIVVAAKKRNEYVSSSTLPAGVLIEGASTNLALRSEDFTDAAWTFTELTVSSNVAQAPDRTMTADMVTETTATGSHRFYQPITTSSGAKCTASIFVKYGSVQFVRLFESSNILGGATVFDIRSGSVVSGPGTMGKIGDYWRLSIVDVAVGTTFVMQMQYLSDSQGASYAGSTTRYSYLWGAQVEEKGLATSYIPTTTAAVSRAADFLTFDINGNIPPVGGGYTQYIDFSLSGNQGSFSNIAQRMLASLDYTAGYYQTVLSGGANPTFSQYYGNQGLAYTASYPSENLTSGKFAFTVENSNCKAYKNGALWASNIVTGLTIFPFGKFYIGSGAGNVDHVFGRIKELMIFDEALTADEVAML